jgi:hypothetical protein
MRRERLLILGQCVAAIAVLVIAPVPDFSAGLRSEGLLVLVFAGCVAVLTSFSVWLPRGDSVDSTAPMMFAAGVLVTPPLVSMVLAVAWACGIAMQRRSFDLWRFLEHASRRAVLMSAAYLAIAPVIARGGRTATLAFSGIDYVVLACCGALFVALDLLVEQAHTSVRLSVPYWSLVISNIQLRSWMIVAEMSVGVLTVLIYVTMGPYGLAISTGMLLVMRQSFALLLEMRASYTATVEVLARSLEAYDPGRRGHAERVARMAVDAAHRLGFQSKRVEDVTYAALFHDVGRLGADDGSDGAERTSSEVLSEVRLLSGALPVLRILDSLEEATDSPDEQDLVGAYLVARLSEFDSVASIGEQDSTLGDAIGARLYANTRRTVDRILRQVERTVPESSEPGASLTDVIE